MGAEGVGSGEFWYTLSKFYSDITHYYSDILITFDIQYFVT